MFLENQDSFCWNVIDALPFAREQIEVVPSREADRAAKAIGQAQALVIGPGPLDPERAGLTGLVQAALRRGLPTLGICLGQQAIGLALGAKLRRVAPVHGHTSVIDFSGSRLFPGFDGPLEVMRYHSLCLAEIGPPLTVVAATAEGLPMAIEHQSLPVAGLQFHPDSFATPRGPELLAAFFRAVT